MSSLRSAVAEYAAEDLATVDDPGLMEDLVEMTRQLNALEAQRTRRVAELDTRRCYEDDGAVSAAAWMRYRCKMTAGAASDAVRVARAMAHLRLAARSYSEGELDTRRMSALVRARTDHPDMFARDEAMLVDHADTLSAADFHKALTYWRHAAVDADGDGETPAEALHRKRRLHLSTTWGGMVRADAEFDPEAGAAVMTAVNAMADPRLRDRDDERSPAQARADALVEICRDYLDHADTPVTGVETPHLLVLVDLEALEGRAGRTCEMDTTGVVTSEAARRLACDAKISRIITNGASQPLDVGRATRVISPAIRRALIVRDGGCAAAGCDRPHRWCDAHHILHWIDGGTTCLINLILLCRRHHTMIHSGIKLELRAPPLRE
jgi:hypothetical protein